MRLLVTGSSGRVGRAVVFALRAQGHEVCGLDRMPADSTETVADLLNMSALAAALRGAQAVVHAAALHAPHVPLYPASAFERVNVEGTRGLIRCAREAGVGHIVYTSTTALYGDAATPPDRAAWVTEALVPQPRTVYHLTKLAAEALLAAAAGEGGLKVTVLRMARCFPEPAPVMAAYRLHRGIDVRDVAAAHAAALASEGPAFRRFIVAAATPFRPEDLEALHDDAEAVWRLRAPALVQAFAARGWPLPAQVDRVYVPTLAEAGLGWVAQHGFHEVLRQADAGSPEVLPPPLSATLSPASPPG